MSLYQTQQRQKLRSSIRQRRNDLSRAFQIKAEQQLLSQLSSYCTQHQVKSVAIYLANDGELQTDAFISWCWQHNVNVYLPVIHPFSKHHLLFLHYSPETEMQTNRFGIREPMLNVQQVIAPTQLDVLFTPLVAFDAMGNRMGMGGGFYDRTLAHLNNAHTQVIGLAHDCQQVESIPTEPWDIPLSQIITPTQRINCQ
ncbi:5-formyltetrahydrofolate cyclo-ligase [Thalassotalea sp. LPB0316]|uniref:5-formyltetrahydrofolate cyclo-ligase n=1 Tax=Thalassotalea sp. LPB0316 TaxID=2769490 RepID=UPI001869644D|nr:5-formyltetrahydrofolate cyclo-ligase [Thalassotalea sp. LPB0316]QOL24401.1 5-formyltetrahydrofolate cyclo-ligase [Thalassotalea sp. LPB0316]